jgi:hypothetical protein
MPDRGRQWARANRPRGCGRRLVVRRVLRRRGGCEGDGERRHHRQGPTPPICLRETRHDLLRVRSDVWTYKSVTPGNAHGTKHSGEATPPPPPLRSRAESPGFGPEDRTATQPSRGGAGPAKVAWAPSAAPFALARFKLLYILQYVIFCPRDRHDKIGAWSGWPPTVCGETYLLHTSTLQDSLAERSGVAGSAPVNSLNIGLNLADSGDSLGRLAGLPCGSV